MRGIPVAIAGLLVALGAGAALAGDSLPGRNGRIAYVTVRKGAPRIWTMTPAGTAQRALTSGTGVEEAVGGPAWSPDGRRLAFTAFALAIMSPEGGGKRYLEPPAGASQSGSPSFSPDGLRIVFESDRDGAFELWLISAGGGQPLHLTDQKGTQVEDRDPAWSPDGKRIAFVRGTYSKRISGYVHDVYTMNVDGTGLVNLTKSAADEYAPDWSPDGTRLVFARLGRAGGELWTIRADGSSPHRLTTGRVSDLQPAWSPDGKLIAFARGLAGHPFLDARGRFDIHVMNADGSGIRRITRNPDVDAEPAWQPLPR